MDSKEKLITLLDKYQDEYKKMKEKYKIKRTDQTLYEELINILTEGSLEENKLSISMLLDTIYKDDIYINEFYRILLQNDNEILINEFIEKIKKEYTNLKHNNKSLKIRIDRNYEMYLSSKRVKASLKYQTPISKSKNDIFNIKRIISYYETSGIISNKEELLLINEIELHNRKIETNRKKSSEEQDYTKNLYNEIPNILNIGFQEHDVIEVFKDRKKSLDKFAFEIINIIDSITIEEINDLLESYEIYNLDNSEYNYILVSVLDVYLEELITLYELLIDKEVYQHRMGRLEVIKNYYQTLEKYLTVRNYYNKISEYVPDETPNEELIKETSKEKRLIYSRSNVNITKAKLISDMADIPYEYYETVYDLITKFKNGTIGIKELKTLTSHKQFRGHLELKYDQVRIIIKHVKDNIYNVLGVFAKKDDNDIPMYRVMTNRMTSDVSTDKLLSHQLELSEITEKELEELVKEKSRKGTR